MNKVEIDLANEYRKVRKQVEDLSKKIDVDKLPEADKEEIKEELQSAIDLASYRDWFFLFTQLLCLWA